MIDDFDRPKVWIKYECERGCRWTAVKGGVADISLETECTFSGCETGHRFTAVGQTTDPKEANEWFKDIHRGIGE